MFNIIQLKQVLKPTIVVEHYLGQPVKRSNIGMWYKSPFRNERTASFLVSDVKGIHDFGSSIHYDIISFVQDLFKIGFKTAVSKLSSDFHLTDCEPTSKELTTYLIKKKEEELQMKKNLDSWFYSTYGKLCDKLNISKKIALHTVREARAITYFYMSDLEYWIDLFINADEQAKFELYKSRGEIEECLNKI